ncbi:MAG: hypothetical protein HY718_21575 [Planctomycetes bacterium]|nr:hypothetical protein [Planctomycetota bacterium]
MRSNVSKLAAAAAVIAVAVVSFVVFHGSAQPAYAIEQTLEANRALTYVHIRIEPAGQGLAEAWAQFDDEGKPLRLRMEFPNTEDGPKSVVWQGNKAEVWFKAKNSDVIMAEPRILARFPEMLEVFDPRVRTEAIYKAQAAGAVTIEVKPPADAQSPITLIATATSSPGGREIYQINPVTKLVQQAERYELQGEEYRFVSRFEYLEYNEEPAPDVFTLNPPADVMRIDQTMQVIGVARGDLSDNEIAVKVAREFFEAMIAGDYAKAGQIAGGIPAEKMKEGFGELKFKRIVSIGTPTPHPDPRTHFLRVPCEVEVEADGVRQTKAFTPNIRHAYNQPDRWVIGGGI